MKNGKPAYDPILCKSEGKVVKDQHQRRPVVSWHCDRKNRKLILTMVFSACIVNVSRRSYVSLTTALLAEKRARRELPPL